MTFEDIVSKNYWIGEYFSSMPRHIMARVELTEFEEGSVLISKGVHCPYLYIIITGKLSIINEYPNGKKYCYASRVAPGFLGLLEYFSEQYLPSSTCMASGPLFAARMRISDFKTWIEEDFNSYKRFARYVAKAMYESINRNGMSSALSKTHVLTEYFITNYESEIRERGICRIPLTREQLALSLGISQRTTYRSVNQLKEMDLLSIDKGKISIDEDQLEGLMDYLATEEN